MVAMRKMREMNMTADTPSDEHDAELEFDGSCIDNPGPAGYGFVLETTDQTVEENEYIGEATNNVAEWHGLLAGLRHAQSLEVDTLLVRGDSQLVIRQAKGEYDVNDEGLQPLHEEALDLADNLDQVDFEWVQRDLNTDADELAQQAVEDH